MLRKLLFFILLIGNTTIFAQKTGDGTTKPKIDYTQTGAPMPKLDFEVYNDTSSDNATNAQQKQKNNKREFLTNSDLDNSANLIVMMFNPNCSHCQDETEMLEKNIFLFNKSKLIMVADQLTRPYLPLFVKSFHIAEYPSIYIGFDVSNFIKELFLYQPLPQVNIYSADRKLLRTFTGEIVIDSLKRYIQ